MEPLFTPTSGEQGGEIRGASELQRGIKQIAAASTNINGPCETPDFKGALSASRQMEKRREKKKQHDGGIIRCIIQMFAVLRRLYYNPPSTSSTPPAATAVLSVES